MVRLPDRPRRLRESEWTVLGCTQPTANRGVAGAAPRSGRNHAVAAILACVWRDRCGRYGIQPSCYETAEIRCEEIQLRQRQEVQ